MRTACLLTVSHSIPCIGGEVCPTPRMQTILLLDADPPQMQTLPRIQIPLPPGYVTCDACWEANPLWMTHRCKNITFSQRFAGGKKHCVTCRRYVKHEIKHDVMFYSVELRNIRLIKASLPKVLMWHSKNTVEQFVAKTQEFNTYWFKWQIYKEHTPLLYHLLVQSANKWTYSYRSLQGKWAWS